MTHFKQEIVERLSQLKSEGKLIQKKKEFSKIYLGSITEEDGPEITELSEFHIAFIDLITEKNTQFSDLFTPILESKLKEMMEPGDFDKINLDDDVSFYCLNVPKKEGNDEWTIELATSFDETIFHVYFNGWELINIGVTH